MLRLRYKDQLRLLREMIAADTENQAKHRNTIFGQIENVYAGGTYSYHCSLG
jgi:hypothetical protein